MAITERTTNMIFNGGFLCQVSMRPKLGIHQVKNNKWAWQCIENLVPDRKNCWTEKQQSNPVPKFQVFMEQSSADKCDDSMGFELSKDFIKLLYDMFGWVFLGCRESFCRTPFYSLMLQLVQWEVPWRKQQCFVFSLCKLPTSTWLEKKKKKKTNMVRVVTFERQKKQFPRIIATLHDDLLSIWQSPLCGGYWRSLYGCLQPGMSEAHILWKQCHLNVDLLLLECVWKRWWVFIS